MSHGVTPEPPADELAEAELPYAHKLTAEQGIRYLREEIAPQANREMLAGAARAVVAEYGERGRELERLRLEKAGVEGERDAADDSLAMLRGWLGIADEVGWMNVARARISELERLRAKAFAIGVDPDYDPREELAQLRARDKKISAAIHEARRLLDDWQTAEELGTVEEWAVQISETLARAHEEEGTS